MLSRSSSIVRHHVGSVCGWYDVIKRALCLWSSSPKPKNLCLIMRKHQTSPNCTAKHLNSTPLNCQGHQKQVKKKKKELLTILPLRVWFPEQEIIRNAESHSKEPHKQNMHFNKVIPYVQQSLVHWS